MSRLSEIPFESEPAGVKAAVKSYWSKRSGSFSEHKHDEAHSYKAELWRNELCERIPAGGGLRILDVGCGAGFFEMVLAHSGYRMTGIDLTPDMIGRARQTAEILAADTAPLRLNFMSWMLSIRIFLMDILTLSFHEILPGRFRTLQKLTRSGIVC